MKYLWGGKKDFELEQQRLYMSLSISDLILVVTDQYCPLLNLHLHITHLNITCHHMLLCGYCCCSDQVTVFNLLVLSP